MNPDNLTDEELRQWIAQKCGYVKRRCDQDYDWREPGGQFTNSIPDYLNSLDAMHEAEKSLDNLDHCQFREELFELCAKRSEINATDSRAYISATARQRAQAFYLATK